LITKLIHYQINYPYLLMLTSILLTIF